MCCSLLPQFAAGVDSSELKSMRDSVSTWTASATDDQERGGGASVADRPLIGPQRPGASSQSVPDIGPSVGPSYHVSRS